MPDKDGPQLYKFADLLAGYAARDPIGYTRTFDFRTFQQYVADGGPAPTSPEKQHQQAEHDARITIALCEFLQTERKLRLTFLLSGNASSVALATFNRNA